VNLIVLTSSELNEDGHVLLRDARAVHITRVLKAQAGQPLRVGILDGPIGTGTVSSITNDGVTLRCAFDSDAPLRPKLDLMLALPRPKVMRRLWAQLAAIGVGRIIITNATRVERNYFDTHVLEEAVYRPLLIEGLQQAGDTRLPVVSVHRRFKVLVEDELDGMVEPGLRLVADPRGEMAVTAIVRQHAPSRSVVAVGPEGGWTGFEIGLLTRHGFRLASMGQRTLRVDTACLSLLALVHDAVRDS
jgi:16S rRNA (uracil1498-N3)-methyltransferase